MALRRRRAVARGRRTAVRSRPRLGTGVTLAYNRAVFGRFRFVSNQAIAHRGTLELPGEKLGFVGVHWPGFDEFFHVLGEITLRPQRGLLYAGVDGGWVYAQCPVLWLAVPGLVLLWRRGMRVEAGLTALATVQHLVFNACYGDRSSTGAEAPRWDRGTWSCCCRCSPCRLRRLRLDAGGWRAAAARGVHVSHAARDAVEPRVPYEVDNLRGTSSFRAGSAENSGSRGGPVRRGSASARGRTVAGSLGKMAGLPGPWQSCRCSRPGSRWASRSSAARERARRARRSAMLAGLIAVTALTPPVRAALGPRKQ